MSKSKLCSKKLFWNFFGPGRVGNSDNRANSVQLPIQLQAGTELGNIINCLAQKFPSFAIFCGEDLLFFIIGIDRTQLKYLDGIRFHLSNWKSIIRLEIKEHCLFWLFHPLISQNLRLHFPHQFKSQKWRWQYPQESTYSI